MAFRGQNHEPPPTFPIVDVLIHYGGDPPSKGSGWAPVRCPFHGSDRNPSASVHEGAQRFCCHTCMERSEDAIGLVMWHEQVTFKAALEIVQGIADPIDGEVRGGARKSGGGALRSLFG